MPTFAILAVVQATLIFTIALIMIPLPTIAAAFGLDAPQLLLLQVAYGLPFSGLLLFGGRLADRQGGRPVLIAGLVLFGLASTGAAVAPAYPMLLAMRFLEGVGAALVAPAAVAALRVLFPDPAAFGRAMAVWGGVSVLGAVLGFVSSGLISGMVSWRWMFAVPVAVTLIGLIAATGLPAGGRAATRPGLDPLGAVLAPVGIVLASYGLIASHADGWTSNAVLLPLGAGMLVLVVFFAVERRSADPLLPPGFLADPTRAVGLAGMLLAAAGSLLAEYVLLLYLQEQRGWTTAETAASFLPFAVALIAANAVAASIVALLGPGRATAVGFLVAAAGFGWLATLDAASGYVAVLLPGQVLLAIGMALAFSGAAVLSTAHVPPQRMGLAGGVMNTAMELGPTLGFAILMAIAATRADTVAGYALAFAAAAGSYVIAAVAALAVARG